MKRLLLVEDEEVILKALRRLLERNHFEVQTATTVEQAIEAQPQSFDLVLADLRLPGATGTTIIPLAEPVPVVIMTSHASVRSAVEAMRHGAIDYIAKPFDHDELLMVIQRALMQNLLHAQNRALRLDVQRIQPSLHHIKGTALEQTLKVFAHKKESDRCLHLHGEPGTDREGLARAIHATSDRNDAPFVVADISARSVQQDAEALLGTHGDIPATGLPPGGLLQAAHNGTLVIRHPEHLSTETQNRLAEALSRGAISVAEGGRQHAVNVRTITLSHESITQLSADARLIAPLAKLFIDNQFGLPALRDRPDDILPLAYEQLHRLERRYGLGPLKFSAEALAALKACEWTGNVAELDSVLARAVLSARGGTVSRENLGLGHNSMGAHDLSLDGYFRYFVLLHQGTLSETELAARLGISRKALWERRQKMDLLRQQS